MMLCAWLGAIGYGLVVTQYICFQVKKRFLLPGGGAPEMEVAVALRKIAQTKLGADHYCWKVG